MHDRDARSVGEARAGRGAAGAASPGLAARPLAGVVDCHAHHGPDIIERRQTAEELAQEAAHAGMGGVVLKSHEGCTAMLAGQVDRIVTGTRIYGSVTLNRAVGGLNPAAVRVAGELGAKVVWMPTTSARNHLEFFGADGDREPGLSILDDAGAVRPVVGEILGEARATGMAVATGHLSARESLLLAEHAAKGGFPMHRFAVTHCDLTFTWLDEDEQQYVAGLGGFLERLFMLVLSLARKASPDALTAGVPYTGRSRLLREGLSVAELVRRVRAPGVSHSIFSSDLGQAGNPDPVAGIGDACQLLRDAGLTRDELREMTVMAPRRFLGLPVRTSKE